VVVILLEVEAEFEGFSCRFASRPALPVRIEEGEAEV